MKGIIVGLGGWGSSWSQVIRDSGWEIAAWVDINPDALRNAVTNLGANQDQCYSGLDEALRKSPADAVFIFTEPTSGRAKDIIAAMDAGLHVLAEKPLTASPDEMTAILDKHRSSGVKLMVGQNYRYMPGSVHMRNVVRSGDIGALGYMNVLYHMAINLPGSHVRNMENGMLLSMCIHHLDMMRFVIGAEPETILAKTWNPPWSWTKADACVECVMTFPGSVTVNYFAGWAAHRSETDWFGHWNLEFEKGMLFSDGVKSFTMIGDEVTETSGPVIDATHTRYDVLQEFTSAIEEDRTPECTVEDNAKSLRIAFSIIESARLRREIDFAAFAEANLEHR